MITFIRPICLVVIASAVMGCASSPTKHHIFKRSPAQATYTKCYEIKGGANQMWGRSSFICIAENQRTQQGSFVYSEVDVRWGSKITENFRIDDQDVSLEIHHGQCINCFSKNGFEISLSDRKAVEGSNLSGFKMKFSPVKALLSGPVGTVQFAGGLTLNYAPFEQR